MLFGDRSLVGSLKPFSPEELVEYVESLLRESKIAACKTTEKSNYSWLRSRSLDTPVRYAELDEFKIIVQKMSSESCALIAVKLDEFTETVRTPPEILDEFQNLLKEQLSIQLLDGSVKRAKEKIRRKKTNKVHPILSPPGRQPTVSFIL